MLRFRFKCKRSFDLNSSSTYELNDYLVFFNIFFGMQPIYNALNKTILYLDRGPIL